MDCDGGGGSSGSGGVGLSKKDGNKEGKKKLTERFAVLKTVRQLILQQQLFLSFSLSLLSHLFEMEARLDRLFRSSFGRVKLSPGFVKFLSGIPFFLSCFALVWSVFIELWFVLPLISRRAAAISKDTGDETYIYYTKYPVLSCIVLAFVWFTLWGLTLAHFIRVVLEDNSVPETAEKTPISTVCEVCSRVKPPRAHHCSKCGKCILKMDHHCLLTVSPCSIAL